MSNKDPNCFEDGGNDGSDTNKEYPQFTNVKVPVGVEFKL